MSTKAQAMLEEFQRLPLQDQREISDLILRQLAMLPQLSSRRRSIADIAGKYQASPDTEAIARDEHFATEGFVLP